MPEFQINGIPVNFPFEPYQIQRNYMARVIECLQNGTNGVLESPTGTGKTLSLLCSSLAWVLHKKAQVQADMITDLEEYEMVQRKKLGGAGSEMEEDTLNEESGTEEAAKWSVPKVVYASRTHSQLTQAMQEMKNSSYSFMKAVVLGSRDQLCIHPDVSKEDGNAAKTNMCKAKIQSKACSFYSGVESCKKRPELVEHAIMDIEDLVKVGRQVRACPFFLSKELIEKADILFMPYNYLLDPTVRKRNNFVIKNTIIILDEAHNAEKMCEESASTHIKSSDIALCIDDVTSIMKVMESGDIPNDEQSKKDFTIDDLELLKEMLLQLEKTVDDIPVRSTLRENTFPGTYIFDLFEKANIKEDNYRKVAILLENINQYISNITEKYNFVRCGGGLQILAGALSIIFAGKGPEYRAAIDRCFKVHIENEEQWKTRGNTHRRAPPDKKVNFWCFNPGFGMRQLLSKNARSIILTSGTLAPLKPLISELDMPVAVRLENPHIIDGSQVCVRIVGQGSDKEGLNSCYDNRDNPKYIQSLGRTILSFCPIIPGGLLVFFPSYPVLNKCREAWQQTGIWGQIIRTKPIFVEPRGKEQFLDTMTEYYQRIDDPEGKGAVFMAVCRGKVSEGLDFADMNGRAVIIIGLPFPPLYDPRVMLKKQYLEEVRTKENEIISGSEWYSLEAARTVNQAIGRVIRHKNDYGAILLCDDRFHNYRQKSQLSGWIQKHLTQSQSLNFGPIIGELSRFFRNAEKSFPQSKLARSIVQIVQEPAPVPEFTVPGALVVNSDTKRNLEYIRGNVVRIENSNQVSPLKPSDYHQKHVQSSSDVLQNFNRPNAQAQTIDFIDMTTTYAMPSSSQGLVTIHKRERTAETLPFPSVAGLSQPPTTQKKRKLIPIPQQTIDLTSTDDNDDVDDGGESRNDPSRQAPEDSAKLLKLIKNTIGMSKYASFLNAVTKYNNDQNFDTLMTGLLDAFDRPGLFHLLRAMQLFVKDKDKEQFQAKINSLWEQYFGRV